MSWKRTQRHFLALDPARVWDIVSDPRRLPDWNPAVHSLLPREGSLAEHGQVGSGSPGIGTLLDLVPNPPLMGVVHANTAPPAVITHHRPGTEFGWRQPQPGGGLSMQWTIAPADGGTLLTQRVAIEGPASGLLAATSAKPLAAHFAPNCARLFRLAGGRPSAARKVVIAGGTGFLGSALAADLVCRGHDVVVLTRTRQRGLPFRQALWDGRSVGRWAGELAGSDVAVVNLAGKPVDAARTQASIAAVRDSRVNATHALVVASSDLRVPVSHWVQASTTAIHSDAGEARITEDTPLPEGAAAMPQMTGVARAWEEACAGANARHLAVLRTAVVLERECPAFRRLALLARSGVGGRLGSGRQWVSWVHLADWLRIVRAALGLEPGVDLPSGVVVAAAPQPVRNAELMRMLRGALAPGGPGRMALPLPAALVRAGAAALRTDPALGLTGRHATSSVLAAAGFHFEHPDLASALDAITA